MKNEHLTIIQRVLAGQKVRKDHFPTTLDCFMHLRRQSMAVVFQPPSAVHTAVPDLLDRTIVCSAITVIIFAERKEAFEVIASAVEAKGGQESGGSAVAVDKRVDVDKLELGQTGHEYGMDVRFPVEPVNEVSHELGDVPCWRRSVDDLACFGIGDEVLDAPVFTRSSFSAADTDHKQSMDFANECLGDGAVAENVSGDELERLAIVEQFKAVISRDAVNLLSCEQFFGLFEGQLRAFDMCGVVGLQQQGAAAHVCNPLFRQGGSLEEASGTFNDR